VAAIRLIFVIAVSSLLGTFGLLAGSHLLFLDPAFVVLLDPHAARLLAIGLILCVPYPGKGGAVKAVATVKAINANRSLFMGYSLQKIQATE
jgi:hypothetical protein